MGDNLTAIIVAVLGSSIVLEIAKAIIGAFKRIADKKTSYVRVSDLAPIKEGLMALMQSTLEASMTIYLDRGEITATQAKSLETMVNAYEDCGGDGFIHNLYEKCRDLDVTTE